jgi:CDP-L-myo-inositol myo-inositolphosphotransferase
VTPSALIIVRDPIAHETFCGRTLVERHILLLRRAGVADIRVVPRGESAPAMAGRASLLVTAERVFDPRLYAAVVAGGGARVLLDRGEPIGLELRRQGEEAARVEIATLDSYSRELRRSFAPFWTRVEHAGDRPAVVRMLVEASGKGHQDLPSAWLNAPIEQAIMRRLADTRVTPNQLTVLCNVVAYAVAGLLATGHLLAGAIGALVVGVLDGLDGRQARIQVRFTTFGRLEHVLDRAYEILWIAALAYWLSDGFVDTVIGWALGTWLAAYALDTAAYDTFKWRSGVNLDEASPLDARIRLVAGRRNVYACLLLAGVLGGQPLLAFHAIAAWAAATALVHWARVVILLAARHSGGVPAGMM